MKFNYKSQMNLATPGIRNNVPCDIQAMWNKTWQDFTTWIGNKQDGWMSKSQEYTKP